jgi:hypothetical protein
MLRAVVDTHAIIWYIFGDTPKESLRERRLSITAQNAIAQIASDGDAVLVEAPFNRDVANALRLVNRTEVPDLPDRIIAATALQECDGSLKALEEQQRSCVFRALDQG